MISTLCGFNIAFFVETCHERTAWRQASPSRASPNSTVSFNRAPTREPERNAAPEQQKDTSLDSWKVIPDSMTFSKSFPPWEGSYGSTERKGFTRLGERRTQVDLRGRLRYAFGNNKKDTQSRESQRERNLEKSGGKVW